VAVSSPARGGSGRFCSSWWVMAVSLPARPPLSWWDSPPIIAKAEALAFLGVEKPLGQVTDRT